MTFAKKMNLNKTVSENVGRERAVVRDEEGVGEEEVGGRAEVGPARKVNVRKNFEGKEK
jgi:hypothetical protein